MKTLIAAVTVLLMAKMFYDERRNLKFAPTIWSRFKVSMFFEVSGVFLLVLASIYFLKNQHPVLRFGWMEMFGAGTGNMSVAPFAEAAGSSNYFVRVLAFIFMMVLLAYLPFIAHLEEKWFRNGHYRWSGIIAQSIWFGLIHCLVGVSLGVGIVIIGVGLFLACKYRKTYLREIEIHGCKSHARKEALLVSTTYHTFYNTIAVLTITAEMLIISWR